MKANGFTLVEILGVVLILSLIVILAFPTIIENIRKSEKKIDETSNALIENAVDLYIDDKKADYSENGEYCIDLTSLAEEGYIKEPFIDVKTGKEIEIGNKSVKVTIGTEGNTYEYDWSKGCTAE